MNDREQLLVELVDGAGTAIGACTVAEAHTAPGRPHRAFSVLLYDDAGRMLLQRRAAVKTRFASRWSNTCCGHPAPGQEVTTAAVARLAAELGLAPHAIGPLTEAGVYTYRAVDEANGRVEDEWDHVLLGTLRAGAPIPDPAEVSECDWVAPDRLHASMTATPDAYTPWFSGVLRVAAEARCS
ncbi:isopentenyl-diphosphate Delta-isomerase [Pseudonocardia acaciae]|uniref:isopentenyl-diphosphate Delta-isomerase n=1 Tax=Pseudonocardia acaciae TaxID=551276 RepID=UPI00049194E0|nr:isopentenyl-diphosphate Delta-isomerase [Pseudonocardia acaciae]